MSDADPLRGIFPLTLAHAGEDLLRAYREAHPTADDAPDGFLAFVCGRYARGLIPDRGVRDLARYEAARAELAAIAPPPAREPGPVAASDVPCMLSPLVRLIMFGADLTGMAQALREGRPAQARPRRAWVLLERTAGGIEESVLERDEGWLLEWFREPRTPEDALDPGDEETFAQLWKRGIIVAARG